MSECVGDDFFETMGGEILIVVDVWLDLYAVDQSSVRTWQPGCVMSVNRELDVADVELGLFEALGGIGVKCLRIWLGSKRAFFCRFPKIRQYVGIHVAEEAILFENSIHLLEPVAGSRGIGGPSDVPVVVERLLYRE